MAGPFIPSMTFALKTRLTIMLPLHCVASTAGDSARHVDLAL